MEWYRPLLKLAAQPPAYLVERISDLQYACDIAKTSPRNANQIISEVISQLSSQHDDGFITPLKDASKIMLDSPSRATEAIEKVVEAMLNEKTLQEAEREEQLWTKKENKS